MHLFRSGGKEKRAKVCSQECACALVKGTLGRRSNFSVSGAEISHWCFFCVSTGISQILKHYGEKDKTESKSSIKGA